MRDFGITYDHTRFQPKEENLKKLEQSLKDAAEQEQHEIRCPICGLLKAYAFGEKKGIVRIKCSRCKYDGPMNLAYFRRRKLYSSRVRFEPWRFRPDTEQINDN